MLEDCGSEQSSEKGGRRDSQSRTREKSLRDWRQFDLKRKEKNVVRIDIKTCKQRQWSLSRKPLSLQANPIRGLPLEPLQPKQLSDSLKSVSSRHVRRPTDLAMSGSDPDSVFVLDSSRLVRHGSDGKKANTSTYKLARTTRKRGSMEIDPAYQLDEEEYQPRHGFSTQTLKKIVKESADEPQPRRKSAIKHLRAGSGAFAPERTNNSTLLGDSMLKSSYFIKTRKNSITEFGSLRRYGARGDEGKSRAERLWAWKGKKGALGKVSI